MSFTKGYVVAIKNTATPLFTGTVVDPNPVLPDLIQVKMDKPEDWGSEYQHQLMSVLTPEQDQQLTPYNAVAFDMLRVESKAEDKIPPCWLVLSEESRNQFRKKLQVALAAISFDIPSAERAVSCVPEVVELGKKWRDAEIQFAILRLQGNPKAFFAS